MPMLQYSEDERRRFGEFAALFLTCRGTLRQVFEETGMAAAPGSYAQADDRALLERVPPVSDRAAHAILTTVQPYLYAASEQIGALSALYSCDEVLLGPLVLARSAIEYCAHALWILGDPNQEVEARVARAFLDELHGAWQALRQAANQFGKDSDVYLQRLAHYEDIRSAAHEMFEPPYTDPGGRRRLMLGRQRLPSHSEFLVIANRVMGQGLPDDQMRGAYALLSNTVHPTPHAVRELFLVSEQDGEPAAELTRDLLFHENLTKMVVALFYNTITYVMSYYGWDPHGHRQLTEDIDRVMKDLFVGEPPPGPFEHVRRSERVCPPAARSPPARRSHSEGELR
jgi:hypothetical protein